MKSINKWVACLPRKNEVEPKTTGFSLGAIKANKLVELEVAADFAGGDSLVSIEKGEKVFVRPEAFKITNASFQVGDETLIFIPYDQILFIR
jgi:hypothetical protein